jgi:MFS family permease
MMWSAFSLFFIEAFAFASWLPRLPELRAMLALSAGNVGLILLALPTGALVAMPVAGWASTRVSIRALNATCMAWMYLAILAVGLVATVPVLVTVLFAMGLGTGSMGVAMNAAGFDAEQRLGRPILSRCHAMFSLGLAAGGLAAGAFLEAEIPILVHLAIVIGTLFAALAATLPGLSSVRPSRRDPAAPRLAWPRGALLVPAVIALGCLLAEGAALDWSAIYLSTVVAADGALVAAGVTVFAGAMAAARFVGDALTARFGGRTLATGGAALAAVGYGIVAVAPDPLTALVGFLVIGLGLAPVVPIAFRAGAALSPDAPGTGVAAVSTLGYVGFLLGPALVGLTADAAGLRWSFVAISAGLLAVALVAGRMEAATRDPG